MKLKVLIIVLMTFPLLFWSCQKESVLQQLDPAESSNELTRDPEDIDFIPDRYVVIMEDDFGPAMTSIVWLSVRFLISISEPSGKFSRNQSMS